MAEFDEKLNSLLSNPEAMDQIMNMARSLMGGGNAPPGGSSPPPQSSGAGPGMPAAPPWFPGPEQSAPNSGGMPPPPFAPPFGGAGGTGPGPDLNFLSGLGNIDPGTIAALLPVIKELSSSQNSNARQLLFALRPYLKPERQEKVERALQLARLFRVGKQFLLRGDRHV